jgi:putative MATE family efflux protein
MSVEARTLTEAHASSRGDVSEVAKLAYPVVVQTVAETVMQVIDSAMVGRGLGAVGLGAVGFAGLWIWTLFVPFTGTAQGIQAFVSREDGAGTPQLAGRWIWQAIWLLVPAMALWMVVVAFLFPLLVHAIGPSPELAAAGIAFGWARLPGGPAVVVNFALSSFFRGIGDTRTPLVASLFGIATNLVLAYGLIFGRLGMPEIGIVGAGIAQSAASYVIATAMLVAALRSKVRARYDTAPCRPERESMLRFARTSAPIGGQWLLDMTTFSIFGSIVAKMGDASIAASQTMLQLLALSFMQMVAIALSCGTLVGRYIGAGDFEAAERSYRSGQYLGLALTALIAGLFFAVPEQLLSIFSSDPAMLDIGRPLLRLGAFFQVVDAVGIIAGGSLRGAGDTRWPFAVQTSLAWLWRLPAVYIGAVWLQGGVFGAWVGELSYVFVLGMALVLRFRAGHWRSVRI